MFVPSKFKYYLAIAYWFIFRPKTFGVRCVVWCGNEILMVKHSYGNYTHWIFPGGGVNRNENFEEAAKREVLEEVGLEIYNLKKIGTYSSTKEYKRDTVVVFSAESNNKSTKIDPREIAEAQWFAKDNLPDISEYSKKILAMFYS